MNTARSPSIWAFFTILLGFLFAYSFLRKTSDSADNERSEDVQLAAQQQRSNPSSRMHRSGHSAKAASMVSQQLPDTGGSSEFAYGTSHLALPEWARPRSPLDQLIEQGAETSAVDPQIEGMKPISPWIDQPGRLASEHLSQVPSGGSERIDAGRGFLAYRASPWEDAIHDPDSKAHDPHQYDPAADDPGLRESRSQEPLSRGASPKWPDQQFPAQRYADLPYSEHALGDRRSPGGSGWVSGATSRQFLSRAGDPPTVSAGADEEHRPAILRSTIRAGPSQEQFLGSHPRQGSPPTGWLTGAGRAVAGMSAPSGVQSRDDIEQSSFDSPQYRSPMADRKKRYVYQPGYRPDD